jgi:hypothetical protein
MLLNVQSLMAAKIYLYIYIYMCRTGVIVIFKELILSLLKCGVAHHPVCVMLLSLQDG